MNVSRKKDNQEEEKKEKRIPKIVGLCFLIVIAVLLSIRVGQPEQAAVVLQPDYAPVAIEDNAVPMAGPEDQEEAPVVVTGGGSMTLSFTDEVVYSLSSGNVSLFYQNPSSSTHNLVVQIIVKQGENEYLVAQSGLLARGYEVTTLKADSGAPTLSPGGYDGVMRLLFYDTTTNEKAMVDTDIPCTIQVTD